MFSSTPIPRILRRCIRLPHTFSASNSGRLNSSQAVRQAWVPLESLQQPTLSQFQDIAFQSQRPYHLVSSFNLPASERWVNQAAPLALNTAYFQPFQDEVYLPMELTTDNPSTTFTRTTAPLSLFLDYIHQLTSQDSSQSSLPRIYVAQAPLSLLPPELQRDIPSPEFVLKAGKGDIYDSSLWMGPSNAARTPLHRDPNPNILVQVAGAKAVRLLSPETGAAIFRGSQHNSQNDTVMSSSKQNIRGEEMMGQQGQQLDQVIWESRESLQQSFEAVLHPGDGIFIPQGWWHSIRGIGGDINISVNWWFR